MDCECGSNFSIGALNRLSCNDEVLVTTSCVRNVAKLIIFLSYIVIYLCIAVPSARLLILHMDFSSQRRKVRWLMTNAVHLLINIGCLGEIISMILFLAGVQHEYKYIFLPIGTFCYRCMTLLLKAMFKVPLAKYLEGSPLGQKDQAVRRFNQTLWVLNGFGLGSIILFGGVLPLTFYNVNNYLVNLFYLIHLSVQGVISLFIDGLTLWLGVACWKSIKPSVLLVADAQTVKMIGLRARLLRYVVCTALCLPFHLSMSMGPLYLLNYDGVLPNSFGWYLGSVESPLVVGFIVILYFTTAGRHDRSSSADRSGSNGHSSHNGHHQHNASGNGTQSPGSGNGGNGGNGGSGGSSSGKLAVSSDENYDVRSLVGRVSTIPMAKVHSAGPVVVEHPEASNLRMGASGSSLFAPASLDSIGPGGKGLDQAARGSVEQADSEDQVPFGALRPSVASSVSHRSDAKGSSRASHFRRDLHNSVFLLAFRSFAEGGFFLEGLLFWIDVELLGEIDDADVRLALARRIYGTYLAPESPFEINCSQQLKAAIPLPLPAVICASLFAPIQHHIFETMLLDSLAKFEAGPGFLSVMQHRAQDIADYEAQKITSFTHFLKTSEAVDPLWFQYSSAAVTMASAELKRSITVKSAKSLKSPRVCRFAASNRESRADRDSTADHGS